MLNNIYYASLEKCNKAVTNCTLTEMCGSASGGLTLGPMGNMPGAPNLKPDNKDFAIIMIDTKVTFQIQRLRSANKNASVNTEEGLSELYRYGSVY